MAASFIPNSFQTPNAYVDEFMHLLSNSEYKVLSYAVRRIFGFNKRSDRISLSQFAFGVSDKDGNQLDYGTGLSIPTIQKCVDSLIVLGLMVMISDNDPRVNHGSEYSLQLDFSRVNQEALEARKGAWRAASQEKMIKVRAGKSEAPNKTHLTPPLNAISGGYEVAFIHNNQGKPEETQIRAALNAPAQDTPIVQVSFDGDSVPVKRKRGRPTKNEAVVSPEVESEKKAYLARKREIEQAYIEIIGYTPIVFGAAAKAAAQLAKAGYTASDVIGCWNHMRATNDFWSKKIVSGEAIELQSIAKQVPAWSKMESERKAKAERAAAARAQEVQQRQTQQQGKRFLSPDEIAEMARAHRMGRA